MDQSGIHHVGFNPECIIHARNDDNHLSSTNPPVLFGCGGAVLAGVVEDCESCQLRRACVTWKTGILRNWECM